MKVKSEEDWAAKKTALLKGIGTVIEQDSVDKEVLEIMKELINNTKVINTMEEYYEKEI